MEEIARGEIVAAGESAAAIEVENLVIRYGRKSAVEGLSLAGVAMVASVVFGDALRSLVATVAAMFVVLAGPKLVRAFV